jgi:hypothetical protein
MIIFGYAFGTLLGKSLEQSMFRKSIDETSDIVIKNVVKHFKANQLLDPKKGKAYKKYIHKMDHLSLGKDIVKAKVWNRDLLLVWGDDEESVGKPPHSKEELAELQEAFEGDTAIEESISILSTFKQLLNKSLMYLKFTRPLILSLRLWLIINIWSGSGRSWASPVCMWSFSWVSGRHQLVLTDRQSR